MPFGVKNSYYKLKKSNLIKNNDLSDDSLLYFETILNDSIPQKENELTLYYFLKNMFYNNKNKFYNFINNSNFECLVLYTDNITISKHFNLMDKIYIKWDSDSKLYKVSKLLN
jgi:hypothetical protein